MCCTQQWVFCALLLGILFSIEASPALASVFDAFSYEDDDIGAPSLAGEGLAGRSPSPGPGPGAQRSSSSKDAALPATSAGVASSSSSPSALSAGIRPFMALKGRPEQAAARDAQVLYKQGAAAAASAYLLFAAAEPLAQAPGASPALLPLLTPVLLRTYVTQPERCASDTARQLYELAARLYGTPTLQACHYALYQSLRAVFAWVRDNTPLALVQLPGQPDARVALPDPDLVSDLELVMGVAGALADPESSLGSGSEVGDWIQGSCGLDLESAAGLVPPIVAVLRELAADAPMLSQLAAELHESHWAVESSPGPLAAGAAAVDDELGSAEVLEGPFGSGRSGSGSRQPQVRGVGGSQDEPKQQQAEEAAKAAEAEEEDAGVGAGATEEVRARRRVALEAYRRWARGSGGGGARRLTRQQLHQQQQDQQQQVERQQVLDEVPLATQAGGAASDGDAAGALSVADATETRRRRLLEALPSSFFYGSTPSGFGISAPSAMPAVTYPLVFHILLYTDTDGVSVGPVKYGQSKAFVDRLVKITNYMAKPSNVQFYVKEVRSDPVAYPYLRLPSRAAWLSCPAGGASGGACLRNSTWLSSVVVDWPRSINVFVASDSTAGAGVPLGYAWVPASDLQPDQGHVFITWDGVSVDGSNQLAMYNDGSNTLLHELFHHLGLHHTFNTANSRGNSCNDDDYVGDTPATFGSASGSSFYGTATAYCMSVFWGVYGGDWDATYSRWSSTLGIPEADMNAWADTCPSRAGYDELGNYMTYNTPVCFAALGHLTLGQAQRAHFITSELNPTLYRWGQYYASIAAPPPPAASPPPEAYTNICKATRNNCACKSSWTMGTTAYSFCDRIGANNSLSCEVADPASCADCSGAAGPCILGCTGTARQCRKSLAPGFAAPPPPPPRPPSPPPRPPPPPPRTVSDACKKTAAGCDCRSTWIYDNNFASYCAAPDGAPVLWCQVDPSCPTFATSPYANCAASLTSTQCRGDIVRYSNSDNTQPGLPASPPSPPPSPPRPPAPPPSPRPPAPSSVAVARMSGSLVVAANCSRLRDPGLSLSDMQLELATAAQVAEGNVVFSSAGAACSPDDPSLLAANYTVWFPPEAGALQIYNASRLLGSAAGMRAAVSALFTSRWGPVAGAAAGSPVVLRQATLVGSGPYWALRPLNYTTGVVEALLPDGSLGVLCASTSSPFGVAEATAVCRSLGFTSGAPAATPASAASSSRYGGSTLYLDGLSCDSAATRLEQCDLAATDGWAAAGVRCSRGAVAAVTCAGGIAASLDANVTLAFAAAADCAAAAALGSGGVIGDLFAELASRVYKVPASRLALRGGPLSCSGSGQMVVTYCLQFPAGSKASEVDAAENATTAASLKASLGASTLAAKWGLAGAAAGGPVADAGADTGVALDSAALCGGGSSPGSSATRVCVAVAQAGDGASGNSGGSDSFFNKTLIGPLTGAMVIGIGAGILVLIALVIAGIIFMRRRSSARVEPGHGAAVSAWGANSAGGGSGNGRGARPAANTAAGTPAPAAVSRSRVAPAPGVTEAADSNANMARSEPELIGPVSRPRGSLAPLVPPAGGSLRPTPLGDLQRPDNGAASAVAPEPMLLPPAGARRGMLPPLSDGEGAAGPVGEGRLLVLAPPPASPAGGAGLRDEAALLAESPGPRPNASRRTLL
ncbi:hypothetical protein HYH02_010249 [Chlamydomonas schloesseri]|uniref:SRCR domain-containing protein n=1 Tax=Chlamydomonas schloesseri TaxID=2026947 RepID=A0A835TKT2_9CHLO|nr:hypothetical protein HYH02_010249 [Chlamydomonas schloesseri]|eukprot:KAG2440670.1 hypothetical protein HYH02_010249 [Chlamydomonas schloesseri]